MSENFNPKAPPYARCLYCNGYIDSSDHIAGRIKGMKGTAFIHLRCWEADQAENAKEVTPECSHPSRKK